MKQTHDVKSNTPEWDVLRASFDGTASQAPAMMGVSSYKKRDVLMAEKATGIKPEVDAATQKRFDDGHRHEALAMPLAEAIIGEDLYPTTVSDAVQGLFLGASLDGETLDSRIIWEHKQLNKNLAEKIPQGLIDVEYRVQMEQQLRLDGAEKCLFMASKDGDEDTMVSAWYYPDDELWARIIAGWKQFKLDLENYQPVVEVVKPAAKAIMELPALDIQIRGEVKNSNLAVYEEAALSFIEGINTDLQTDQDFADAEKAVKFCGEAEKQLELAKKQILSQAHDIDLITRTLDKIKEEMRSKRLVVDKIVKAEKANRRNEILQGAMEQFSDHLEGLRKSLGGDYLPELTFDPATAMKGKKTITSLQSAANDELARAKIAANEVVERIRMNMKAYSEAGGPDYNFLFGDLKTILQKEREDFLLLVQSRINTHKHAEEAKLEAERQRIRAEEQAKAEREKLAELNRLAQEQEEKDRAAREAEEQKERERLAEERRKEAEIAEAERKAEAERQEKARIDKEEAQKRQGEEYRTELSAKISDSLIENGIGKTVAKKVAELIVAGKIEGVMV